MTTLTPLRMAVVCMGLGAAAPYICSMYYISLVHTYTYVLVRCIAVLIVVGRVKGRVKILQLIRDNYLVFQL